MKELRAFASEAFRCRTSVEDCQIEIPKKTVETVLRDPPKRLSLGEHDLFRSSYFPSLARLRSEP
jgi:hypothetical protein